jgi:hypothetical protein
VNVATFIAATLLLLIPQQTGIVRDRADVMELNHFCDHDGQQVFEQLLFWDWCDRRGCLHIADWRLSKGVIRPNYDYARGEWLATWTDGELLREVKASGFRETWTQHDPEVEDRAK